MLMHVVVTDICRVRNKGEEAQKKIDYRTITHSGKMTKITTHSNS